MRLSLAALLLASSCLLSPSQASTCPSTNRISDPPQFFWNTQHEGILEFGAATFNINGETLTTRAYRQQGGTYSIPGPTIIVDPGTTYYLTLKNTRPYQVPSVADNTIKDSDITNLHTHGLHISGENVGDDVTRIINGGECGDYMYIIPSDHMGGTHWYHPHHHGSTWIQAAAGALGMLIVDDSNDDLPLRVAGMTERQIVIAHLRPQDVRGKGGDTLISGTFNDKWTLNGKVGGNLCVPTDEWQHWRVLLADPDAREKTLTINTPNCEVQLMARDGVWRTQVPLLLPSGSIDLTGASRADLAVKCSGDSTISIGNEIIATIYADDNLPADPTVGPFHDGPTGVEWVPRRPGYLRDLLTSSVVNTETINMGARTVNGDKFDIHTPTFSISNQGVQEWNIRGATNHPFHLHVYHAQVKESCGSYETGEYYDTIAASCTVRIDVSQITAYEGRTIMHCHILQHEDEGAMGWIEVTFGETEPTFPSSSTYQQLYSCGEASPPPTPTPTPPPDSSNCSIYNDKTLCNNDSSCKWKGSPTDGSCGMK